MNAETQVASATAARIINETDKLLPELKANAADQTLAGPEGRVARDFCGLVARGIETLRERAIASIPLPENGLVN